VRFRIDQQTLQLDPERSTVAVDLAAGWHALHLTYRHEEEAIRFRFLWQPPGAIEPALVPGHVLATSPAAMKSTFMWRSLGWALLASWVLIGVVLLRRRGRPGSLAHFIFRHRHEIALALILVVGLLLRMHEYDLLPFHRETADEYQHGWEGWTLLHEGVPAAWTFYPGVYQGEEFTPFFWFGDPYNLARPYFDHPPGFSLLVGAACTLLGAEQMIECTLWRMRWIPILLGLWTIYLVARAGWRFLPDRLAGTLAAFVYATLPAVVLGNRLVKAENLIAPLLLLQALLLARYLERGRRREWIQ
jgi:hypothetical protein